MKFFVFFPLLLCLPARVVSQPVASCVNTLTVDTPPGGCWAEITTGQIDNGSTGSNLILSLAHSWVYGGTTPITLSAIGDGGVEGCSIVDTCVTQVTLNDVEAPYVDCATHVEYDLIQEHYMTELTPGHLVYSYYDNCYDGYNDDVELSVPGGIPTFTCEHVGTTQTITVAATDLAGNVGTCDASVYVTDHSYSCQPTVASCIDALTVEPDEWSCSKFIEHPMMFDNGSVGEAITFQTYDAATSYYVSDLFLGTTTIRTDVHGLGGVDSCTTEVTLVDNVPPEVTCNTYNAYDVYWGSDMYFTTPGLELDPTLMVTSHDYCDMNPQVSFESGHPTFGCADIGTTQPVTMVVTDAAGNSNSCQAEVHIYDYSYSCNPTIASCHSSKTFETDPGTCWKDLTGLENEIDDGSTGTGTVYLSILETYPNRGTSSITLSVYSEAGSETCTSEVTVVDNEDPLIECVPDFEYDIFNWLFSAFTIDNIIMHASDNCYDVTKSVQGGVPEFGCEDLGSHTVTGTATDADGNTATCTVNIQVTDSYSHCTGGSGLVGNLAVASCVGPQSFDADLHFCYKDFSGLESTFDDGSTGDYLSFTLSNYHPAVGTSDVELQVSGDPGYDQCTVQVTINDVEDPHVYCTSQYYDMTYGPELSLDMMASAYDNCGLPDLSFQGGAPTFGCADVGTVQTVTIVATDESGNTATCDTTVTVTDDQYSCQPTVASCLDALTINTESYCGGVLTERQLDNGSTGVNLYFTQPQTNPSPGVHMITTEVWGSGGSDSCTTEVTVVDNVPPQITCHDMEWDIANYNMMQLAADSLAYISDNCNSDGLLASFQGGAPPTFTCAEVGTVQTITMTTTDDAGNTATCEAAVTVTDPMYTCSPTVASCPSTLTYQADPGTCSKDLTNHYADFDNGSTGESLWFSLMDTYPFVGTTNVLVDVYGMGGYDQCTTEVIVVDNEPPTVDCAQELTYDVGSRGALEWWDIIYNYYDNCWEGLTVSIEAHDTSYGCYDVGSTYTVTGVVTDRAGNRATCETIVTVSDTTGCCAVIGTVPTIESPPRTESSPSSPSSPTQNTEGNGDPHFTTWKKEHYEFHGQCDLVMMSDSSFADNIGLDVHIRTKLVRFWSYIKTAAIRIGNDILEIEGSDESTGTEARYWLNYEYQGDLDTIGGFPVTTKSPGPNKREYKIDLGSKYPGQVVIIKTFKEFVGVKVLNGSEEAFGKTIGMSGDFKTGNTFARDGSTVLDDFSELGNEWQVLPSERKLFHQIEEPQFPEKCIMPEDPRGARHRRLDESDISMDEAQKACGGLKDAATIKDCIYDVLATQDVDMVGAF